MTSTAGVGGQARLVNAELDALKGALDHQRAHVLGILEGLSEDDLRRPVLPSGWSCLALLRHLTLDVERFWFPGVIARASRMWLGNSRQGRRRTGTYPRG